MIDDADIDELAAEATAEHLNDLFADIEDDATEMNIQTTPLGANLTNE